MAEFDSNPVPFEVLGDETSTQRIGMELVVYAFDDPTQVLDIVPRRFELKTLDELRGPGGGSFRIMRDDAKLTETPSLLDFRNVCKVVLDRKVVGGFLIQSLKTDFVNRDEKSGEFWEVSGGGLREWFHDAVVEPYGGVKSDSQSTRVFSFASEQGDWYIPADWVAPVDIQQYDLDPNFNPFGTAPAEWPDAPNAHWIWGVANNAVDNPAPEGINYFRYEFDIDPVLGTKNYSVFAAAKDHFDVYMDGQSIIESRETNGYAKTWRADFELGPGHHILASRVLANGTGQAGLIAALFRAGDAAEGTPAELLNVTDVATWKVNVYPDPAPGWTPGEIMLTLLAEASARGVHFPTFLYPSFTTTEDSDGVTWPRSLDWSFDLGTEYYDVIEKLEELVCDVWLDPETMQLNMYSTRGVHRDVQSSAVQPVKFEIGRNVVRAQEEGASDIKNALLLSTSDGWQSLADGLSGSILKYGRIEGYVSTGASLAVSSDVAQSVFSTRAQPETTSTYDIIDVDDSRPHTDFFVGDWVLAPSSDDENVLASRHVMSISIEEDSKTGQPTFAVEFDTIFQDLVSRYERWLKTTSDGTLGGTLANVSGGGGGGGGIPTSQSTQTGPPGLQGEIGPVGISWLGDWDPLTSYSPPDAVAYDGSSYFAVADSVGEIPSDVSPFWDLIASVGAEGPQGVGLVFLGEWVNSTTYVSGNIVTHSDLMWITTVTNINEEPGVSPDWVEYASGGGGGGATRTTATYTTTSLAPGAQEIGLINLAPGYRIYKVQLSRQARARLYDTTAHRTADLSRPKSTPIDEGSDHGLMLEVALETGALTRTLSPVVDGVNFETGDGVPITVDNLDSSSGTVTVTVTYVKSET